MKTKEQTFTFPEFPSEDFMSGVELGIKIERFGLTALENLKFVDTENNLEKSTKKENMRTKEQQELDRKISVMQAFRAGKKIRFVKRKLLHEGIYFDHSADIVPSWNWDEYDYEIVPEKKKVPMSQEDFPPVFWMKRKTLSWHSVYSMNNESIKFSNITRSFQQLMDEEWEYSEDRKEVKPCWKYE